MLFHKSNLVVSQVASRDPNDLGVNCVHLAPDGSTVATNGRLILAVSPVDEEKVRFPNVGEQTTPGGQGVSVPLDLIEKAVKNIPKDKRSGVQYVATTKNRDVAKVEFTTTDLRHEERIAGFPKREPFPDWKGVIRSVRGLEDPVKVCVNRRDLIAILQALDDACPDVAGDNPVFLEVNPEGKGLVLRCVNRETSQRAVGAITAYQTGGNWLPRDVWESGIFKTVKRILRRA